METISENNVTPKMVTDLIDDTVKEKGKDINPVFKSLILTDGKTDLSLNFRGETGSPSSNESAWLANIVGPIFIEDFRLGNLVVLGNGEVKAYEVSLTDDISQEVAYSHADFGALQHRSMEWEPKRHAA